MPKSIKPIPTPKQMTKRDLRVRMADEGWSVRGLAAALGISFRTVTMWRDTNSESHQPPAWLELAMTEASRRVKSGRRSGVPSRPPAPPALPEPPKNKFSRRIT